MRGKDGKGQDIEDDKNKKRKAFLEIERGGKQNASNLLMMMFAVSLVWANSLNRYDVPVVEARKARVFSCPK